MKSAPGADSSHPCFNKSAQGRWGRIHLPVAPECNIRCNYCNPRYDCTNESRPGVTSRVLLPGDAVAYLDALVKRGNDISVVGIAGPGDALCDPERTLETIRAVRRAYPDLLICLSTNGLNLPEHIAALNDAGVTHVTVTINAVDPSVGEKICAWVKVGGSIYQGHEAAELLITRQREAVRGLKSKGIAVKINTVAVTGINDNHVTCIAREVAELGADLMNCIPLIPVAGTPFVGLEAPSSSAMHRIRTAASRYMPLMNHCRRCRADAAGLLEGEPRNAPLHRRSSVTCAN